MGLGRSPRKLRVVTGCAGVADSLDLDGLLEGGGRPQLRPSAHSEPPRMARRLRQMSRAPPPCSGRTANLAARRSPCAGSLGPAVGPAAYGPSPARLRS